MFEHSWSSPFPQIPSYNQDQRKPVLRSSINYTFSYKGKPLLVIRNNAIEFLVNGYYGPDTVAAAALALIDHLRSQGQLRYFDTDDDTRLVPEDDSDETITELRSMLEVQGTPF